MKSEKPIRVRFAPSPTGRFHIGSARTALYNYLLARQSGGKFVFRIEDTDQKRLNPESEKEFIDSMRWMGLAWDEGPDIGGPFGPYRQSERKAIYQEHVEQLIDSGHAYYCFCSPDRLRQMREKQQKINAQPRYDGLCRNLSLSEARQRIQDGESYVVRFRMPKTGQTTCLDTLRGKIIVENSSLDDSILLKSNGLPVYHLAAMVDDYLMQISHVFRGSEWIPTFPLHVQIYQAFGWEQPNWVHLSLFLNPSGKGKLSKRQAQNPRSGVKAVFALDLRDLGYLPEAVNNWIALMGWSYDDHTEFFTMDDLIKKFSIARLSPSPAAVNFSKLDHFNSLHIRALSIESLTKRLLPYFHKAGYQVSPEELSQIIPLIQDRTKTLNDATGMAGFFFQKTVEPDPELLLGKNMDAAASLNAAIAALAVLQNSSAFDVEILEADLRSLADELGLKAGQLFGIMRIAITGQKVSPPLIESMQIIGKPVVIQRMQNAIMELEKLNTP